MLIAERLAQFIVDATFEQLSPQVVQMTENAILDSLGTTIAGSREEAARLVADQVREYHAEPVSTVIGAGFKTAPPLAALANGTSAHALDFDDGTVSVHGHPSVATVPALLAMLEACPSTTGRDLIAAYAIAYEVGYQIGEAINPRHYGLGFHATSTVGVFRAATAAARLLNLDQQATQSALGIAASTSCGLRANFGTMTKPLHAGLADRNGVLAAQLAQRGVTSNARIFEADGGFCKTFHGGEGFSGDRIVQNLGNPFCLENPGIVFKLYPCCAGGHSIIDSLLYLRQTHNLRVEQVESIRCGVNYLRPQNMPYNRPTNTAQARFSIPYCAAVALVDGRAGLEQFSETRLNDPVLRGLMELVEVYVHPSMTESIQRGVELDVVLRDGRLLHHSVDVPTDVAGPPPSHGQLVAKFLGLAEGNLPSGDAARVVELIETLPQQQSLTDLIRLLGYHLPQPTPVA